MTLPPRATISRGRLLPVRRSSGARQHEALPVSGPAAGARSSSGVSMVRPASAQLVDERRVVGVGEPGRDGLGDDRADALDGLDLLRARVRERVDAAEVPGERLAP